MRVLILGFTKIKYMPYLTFYLNAINTKLNQVTVFYWNRDESEDVKLPSGVEGIEFKEYLLDSEKKIKKIPAFIKYRKEARRIIKRGKYDFIIVLHTLPAVLISDVLKKKYIGRYILDYRDYTYERIRIYKNLIATLAQNAKCCFVSSDAFREYLPVIDKIYTSHNLTIDTIQKRPAMHPISTKPIRIRYWGLIRYAATNIKIIDQIKNDDRFEIHFHGRVQGEAEIIKNYCREQQVQNVYFHGEYKPEERLVFSRETDLIQNAQDYDEITKNAVSNKFYDGPIFYIPQICTEKSYMGKCLKKYKIGLPFDYDKDTIADDIYNYLCNLDAEEFKSNCDRFVDDVLREYDSGISMLKDIFG